MCIHRYLKGRIDYYYMFTLDQQKKNKKQDKYIN